MLKYIPIFTLILFFTSCQKDPIHPATTYACSLSFEDTSTTNPKHQRFLSEVETFIGQTPGLQVAVTSADGSIWTHAFGKADIASNIPFASCTKTMIGSISKVITATLILQLQDEGLISIEDKLADHLDDDLIGELANADKVTLRQLLNHTSGIPDYLSARHFINSLNIPNQIETQEEKLKYAYGKPANNEPGAVYNYSNTNYVLLGLIIQKIRGMKLWDAVAQYIAAPLDLQNLVMGTEQKPIPSDCARPYISTRGGKYQDVMEHAVADAATGDGGIATNMQDLNIFFAGLMDRTLISTEAYNSMLEDVVDQAGSASYGGPDFEDEFYSLGLERYNRKGNFAFGHTGSTSSYEAYSIFVPESGVIVSIGFNGLSIRDDIDSERSELIWKLVDIAGE